MYNIRHNNGKFVTRKHYPLVILQAAFWAWYRRVGIVKTIVLILFGMLTYATFMPHLTQPVVYEAHADEKETVVQIEVSIDWTKERIEKEIRKTFPEQPDLMVRVAKCESQLNPKAHNPTNGSHDGGIFQLSEKYHGKDMRVLGIDAYDIQENIKYARKLYDESGLAPWSASKYCWNKK